MDTSWVCKKFSELSAEELYSILQLRSEVFVVEQDCVYLDCDDKDQASWHLMGWNDTYLMAYARLIPPGISYDNPSIGRVVSSPSVRKTGIGRELMKIAIEKIKELFGQHPITIGAQLYLKKFYGSYGFEQTGDIYLEDGIDHIKMTRL